MNIQAIDKRLSRLENQIHEKKYTKAEVLVLIEKWWNDENTCSGEPHCCIKECDLCVNCYNDLKKFFE